MRNHALSGVLYAEDFDAPEPAPPAPATAPPPPPPEPIVLEPTFSLADLRRAAEHAQEAGRALERQESELNAASLRTDALGRIADALNQARGDADRIAADAASATADTVLAAVAAVLPGFARLRGMDEVAALLRLLLPAMSHEPRLGVRVHPSLIDGLRQDLAPLLQDGSTSIDWLASDAMQPGDVNVRWQNGMMVRDMTALCAQVVALIAPGKTPTHSNKETNDGQ